MLLRHIRALASSGVGTAFLAVCWANALAGTNEAESSKPGPDQEIDREIRIENLRAEATILLERGAFPRALVLFQEILLLAPEDSAAQRDAGRTAMATGDFDNAARLLERSHHSVGHHRDSELHYLRGEALYALGRVPEAYSEHRIAELEIESAPQDRVGRLRLARIYVRRGHFERAELVYQSLWPSDSQPADSEVALNHAEARLLRSDWDGAAELLRRFIARAPDNRRAQQMLAWALEAKGALDAELVVRAKLVADGRSASFYQDYGRALERSRDYARATVVYQTAIELDPAPGAALVRARDRMRYRITPEVSAGLMARSDQTATARHLQAGVALPFGSRHLGSLLVWHDFLHGGYPAHDASASALNAALVLGARSGGALTLGGQVRSLNAAAMGADSHREPRESVRLGGLVQVEAPLGRRVRIDFRGEIENQWTEAPISVKEGGAISGLTGHFFVFPLASTERVVIDVGMQARRIRLAPRDHTDIRPEASQLLAWFGVDLVLWHDPTRVLTGEILDDNLVRRTEVADSITLSLRHHELVGRSGADFSTRVALIDRASIDTGSLVVRNVLGGGRFAFDVRGGLGYDRIRRLALMQGGLSLLHASTVASRVSLSFDFAHETTFMAGTRRTGWLTYHADL